MKQFDYYVNTYVVDSPINGDHWGAKPKIWEMTVDKARSILLNEHLGRTKGEAAEKATRAAKRYIAERILEDSP